MTQPRTARMSRRDHTGAEMSVEEWEAWWTEALRDAESDERCAERALADLKKERAEWMCAWNDRRNDAKRELADAIAAKRSAAYAIKTGRDPK